MTATESHENSPTWADVLELVTNLDAGSYADVDLRMPGLRLRMSTTPRTVADEPATAPATAPGLAPTAGLAPAAAGSSAPVQSTDTAPPVDPDTPAPGVDPDSPIVDVVAPMLGTFYGRPSPDAPPFVTAGGTVEPDTTVAIVEVMKLMNPVTAGVAGRVVEVRAADGDLVEHGDVLFRIEPEGTP